MVKKTYFDTPEEVLSTYLSDKDTPTQECHIFINNFGNLYTDKIEELTYYKNSLFKSQYEGIKNNINSPILITFNQKNFRKKATVYDYSLNRWLVIDNIDYPKCYTFDYHYAIPYINEQLYMFSERVSPLPPSPSCILPTNPPLVVPNSIPHLSLISNLEKECPPKIYQLFKDFINLYREDMIKELRGESDIKDEEVNLLINGIRIFKDKVGLYLVTPYQYKMYFELYHSPPSSEYPLINPYIIASLDMYSIWNIDNIMAINGFVKPRSFILYQIVENIMKLRLSLYKRHKLLKIIQTYLSYIYLPS